MPYIYKLHRIKSEKLLGNGFLELKNYLDDLFKNCPDSYFLTEPRASRLRIKLNLKKKQVTGHEVSDLAAYGLEKNRERFRNNHMKVQMFMLENDQNTIAIEIPLWINNNELDNYYKYFNAIKPLTGHIDVLRIEEDKIWIWDYKPEAEKEEFAATQVYCYSLMLSKRTGIGLDKFRCGYFNTKYAYIFKPEENALIVNNGVKTLKDFNHI